MTINQSTGQSFLRGIGDKLEFDELASQQNCFFFAKTGLGGACMLEKGPRSPNAKKTQQ